MEILMLVLLYYLSQNADFSESIKPIMEKLKGSEEMLRFLKDLAKFTETFSALRSDPQGECGEKQTHNSAPNCTPPPKNDKPQDKKDPQSPTAGIADEFIQNILDSYLKKK